MNAATRMVIIPGSGSFASPHRYNVKTAVTVPAGVIIECQTGAEFLDATACTDNMPGLFYFSNVTASVAGAGIYGCMFKGSAPSISATTSYNHSFIRLESAHNFTLEGNFTTNSCGDADIRLDGPEDSASDHGSTGNTIAFNDTEHAENGIALINAWNNTITCSARRTVTAASSTKSRDQPCVRAGAATTSSARTTWCRRRPCPPATTRT